MNISGKIIRRAAAAGCAGIVIMLSGCTDVLQPADSVKSYYEFSDSQFVNDLQAEAKTGAYKAAEHETQALASMEEMLSNEYISLYMGKYYDIAVLDKETGKIFFSNRAIYENPDELSDEGVTVLCLDAAMAGIGSNSCGPALPKEYETHSHVCWQATFELR